MIIRKAEDKDRSVLTSLHITEDIEVHRPAPGVSPKGKLSALSSRAQDIVLVAEDEHEVRGYLWAVALRIFDYRIGLIFDLFVDPSMRLKGVGRDLLKKGMEELHKLGVHRIWANAGKKNAPTRALMESVGFKQSEERDFFELVEPGAKHEWETK